ncbi:MAG: sigma-70 family RNA polymerase sigma factor [Chitinophagaceae bacterium]
MPKTPAGKLIHYNEKQFDQLFRMAYPRLLAYLNKVSGDATVAEDLTQTVFLQLWENRNRLPADETEALYYLFTTARHCFFHFTRKALKESAALASLHELHFTEAQEDERTNAFLQEKEALIAKTLAEIDPVKARCFILSKEEGLNYREIADREGISIKTVMRYVSSVSKILRARLTALLFLYF